MTLHPETLTTINQWLTTMNIPTHTQEGTPLNTQDRIRQLVKIENQHQHKRSTQPYKITTAILTIIITTLLYTIWKH
jgi:hypothetical protein